MTDVICSEGLNADDIRDSKFSADVRIDTSPVTGNAKSVWRLLEQVIHIHLSDLERDLLDLAEAVYLADRNTQRPLGANNLKNIRILIALRRPDKFDPDRVSNILRQLSMDRIRFEIRRRQSEDDEEENVGESLLDNCDMICLVSGGVDSFGGLIQALRSEFSPAIVSYYTSDSTHQRAVGNAVNQRFSIATPQVLIGGLNKRNGVFSIRNLKDTSMRLRSFLYLALAIATAASEDIDRIWMSENGIMTPGIPFSPSRVGPYTTRTTHPAFVREFTKWYRDIAGANLCISNPLEYMTKAEIVRYILDEGFAQYLGSTNSCFRKQYAMRKRHNHCGYCVPCLIRRTAFLSADAERFDDPGGYLKDCFDIKGLSSEGRADMIDLATFAQNCRTQSPDNLITRDCPDLLDLGERSMIYRTVDTLKRFSSEFLAVIERYGKANLKTVLES